MKAKLIVAAACGLLVSGAVQAAELKVLASGAVKEAYGEIIPQFEKASGHKVSITWAGTVDIKKKVAAGEAYDVVIIASNEMDAFVKDGKIVTRGLSQDILHGITRASLLRYAAEAQMQIEERPFTIAEAQAADEAFFTSSAWLFATSASRFISSFWVCATRVALRVRMSASAAPSPRPMTQASQGARPRRPTP